MEAYPVALAEFGSSPSMLLHSNPYSPECVEGKSCEVRSPEVVTWQMRLLHVLATMAALCNAPGLTSPATS